MGERGVGRWGGGEMGRRGEGVTRFIWVTMGDERVRDTHKNVDGKEFDNVTGALGLLDFKDSRFPGDDINCRCWKEPVF